LNNVFRGHGFLGLEGVWKDGEVEVTLVNVYSPCDLEGKRALWRELSKYKANSNVTRWCVMGDYNSIRYGRERVGERLGPQGGREMEGFNQLIEDLELCDIPLVRRSFIWYRPNGKAKSRIDRVLLSIDWLTTWQGCTQYVLNRSVSGHCPLVVRNNLFDWVPKPFKILNC